MNTVELSIDGAVEAWRSAAEIYADVFQTLARATAADPSAAKKQGPGHDDFSEMARTAQAALDAVKGFKLPKSHAECSKNATLVDDNADEESDNEGGSEGGGLQPRRCGTADGCSGPDQEHRRSQEIDETTEQYKQRMAKKQIKRAARLANEAVELARFLHEEKFKGPFQRAHVHRSGHSDFDPLPPKIEYEDLSAEVAVRLKMKDERKIAAKKEKKRKRDSEDSIDLAERNGRVDRLKKKKPRASGLIDDTTVDCSLGTRESKKRHSRNEDEDSHALIPKRRRKE